MIHHDYEKTLSRPNDSEARPGVLAFISPDGGEDVVLTKKMIKLGKDPSSDIVVRGLLVARHAALISRQDDGYYISHVEGVAKPKVNNMPVKKEPVKLEEFDTIQIGSTRMTFIRKS